MLSNPPSRRPRLRRGDLTTRLRLTNNSDLARLLFVQAVLYGLLGTLIGLGMVSGMVAGMRNPQLTPVLPVEAFGISFAVMVGVCVMASVLALLRLRKLEPAMVFR